jgi:hypothetical protein
VSRRRKIANGSGRDTDWQLEEYQRVMGKDAAHRQEHAAKVDRGECVCRRFTIRTKYGYRTIHRRDCIKFKDWMEEHLAHAEGTKRGDAYVRSME